MMNIFNLFENNKDIKKVERIRNIITLYALNKDLHLMNNDSFSLKEDEDINAFFEKYQSFDNVEEIDIEDFPIEKLFLFSIPVYEKLKSGEFEINIDNIPFVNDDFMKDDISESLSNTYIDTFEKELIKLDNIENDTLKEYKHNYQIKHLKDLMDEYIRTEEYEKAAEIRDEINSLSN
jgi:hypothetical protein